MSLLRIDGRAVTDGGDVRVIVDGEESGASFVGIDSELHRGLSRA